MHLIQQVKDLVADASEANEVDLRKRHTVTNSWSPYCKPDLFFVSLLNRDCCSLCSKSYCKQIKFSSRQIQIGSTCT